MIFHVANLDKFIPPFVTFINENFEQEEHLFCVLGDNKNYPLANHNNLKISKPTLTGALKHYIAVARNILRAKKVILHGLFDVRLVILLALMPWTLKKCYWVIWGGDLYYFRTPKLSKKDKIKEIFRAFVIKRVGYLVSYIPGDVDLAREWYGACGNYKECLMYLSNIVDDQLVRAEPQFGRTANEAINIIIGNSADPSNNHMEVFEKLAPYKKQINRLVVPLSYGDKKYAGKIIAYGRAEFEDKFKPLRSFIPLANYNSILQSIDIAIFNHERQQAMGNTITLLGMGKTVYMRKGLPHTQFLENLGISILEISNFDLVKLADKEIEVNRRIVNDYFNKANLIHQLENIFE